MNQWMMLAILAAGNASAFEATIKIHSAVMYTEDGTAVTQQLCDQQEMATVGQSAGCTIVPIQVFAKDPSPGRSKTYTVQYTCGKDPKMLSARVSLVGAEKSLLLPCAYTGKPAVSRSTITIAQALYQKIDVTEETQSYCLGYARHYPESSGCSVIPFFNLKEQPEATTAQLFEVAYRCAQDPTYYRATQSFATDFAKKLALDCPVWSSGPAPTQKSGAEITILGATYYGADVSSTLQVTCALSYQAGAAGVSSCTVVPSGATLEEVGAETRAFELVYVCGQSPEIQTLRLPNVPVGERLQVQCGKVE